MCMSVLHVYMPVHWCPWSQRENWIPQIESHLANSHVIYGGSPELRTSWGGDYQAWVPLRSCAPCRIH